MRLFDMKIFHFHRVYVATLALLVSLWAISVPAGAHNVFATFTRIDWNASDHSVEFVIQLHAHELEARLSLDLGERLTFLEDADYPKLEKSVGHWALQAMDVKVDDKPLPLTYLGMELKGQEVLLYMEADWPTPPKSLTVMNAMFLHDLPGQTNTVMAVVNGARKAGEIRADSDPLRLEF
ncbi:MAG: hypothetical protein EP335_05905 [Alphaproteobacteria bacterium]|nr:MAG: hypothetical protein EP335_05905 [Alphaproteobacteria bacterium]